MSPVHHVAKGKGIPPFQLIHIGVDPQKSQTQTFVKRLKAEGVSVRVHVAQGKGHKKLDEEMGLAEDKPTQAVFEFLDSLLKE